MIGNTNAKTLSVIETVPTAAQMDAKLIEANVGHAYMYTGTTTTTYSNGTIYVVETGTSPIA